MSNLEAVQALCTAMVNTFYPDRAVAEFALFQRGADPMADAAPMDAEVFRAAVSLVRGYVESSRSEDGISTSINTAALEDALRYWCRQYGLDADEELADGLRVLEDGTNLW